MCESTVLLKTMDGERELMVDVVSLKVHDSEITMANLLGEQKTVSGHIESIDFLSHELVIVAH